MTDPTTNPGQRYEITGEELQQIMLRKKKNPLGEGHGSQLISMSYYELGMIETAIRSHPLPNIPTDEQCRICSVTIAAQARSAEAIRWQTALNTLIATESKRKDKESVDMVCSYRVAQIIDSLRQPVENTESTGDEKR